MPSNNGANKGKKYTRWHEQKPEKTEEQKEKRRANVNTAVKKHRAGRPKKYKSEEERRLTHNERQRKVYRKESKVKRDLSTQAGKLGAWQDLIDAM